ncbi:AraC family transcriptional regulator [Rhodocytophaga aerolata]|uniref:AraC family transcriptional regulator n=1 Tax=Rhodocytophaga aerolata TaxID=455078 RepID=A0ABT8RAV3_9BACT|nr:AraC family transcriptional regulator [Rhodocytophaga aerolata]MDO1449212.1 AraC family transcriptional regulator [Rhodocytophaga aerolata]
MEKATLHIKNMVCSRCMKVVKTELENLGLHPEVVKLGEVLLHESDKQIDKKKVNEVFAKHGFELLDDKKSHIIEKIKSTVIELIHYQESKEHKKLSYLIEEKIGLDYTYLSSLFSATEGITIEKYIILQRIERVKELLVYDELTLSEIAWQLGYSSVQHLSHQFKKVTGLTPSHFKEIKEDKRNSLDDVR